jgi:hypothetical protein
MGRGSVFEQVLKRWRNNENWLSCIVGCSQGPFVDISMSRVGRYKLGVCMSVEVLHVSEIEDSRGLSYQGPARKEGIMRLGSLNLWSR